LVDTLLGVLETATIPDRATALAKNTDGSTDLARCSGRFHSASPRIRSEMLEVLTVRLQGSIARRFNRRTEAAINGEEELADVSDENHAASRLQTLRPPEFVTDIIYSAPVGV
jgi:hypothetical protein